ncbi:substrate-binding periplasmic protein, partial [Streptomyces hainanensis]
AGVVALALVSWLVVALVDDDDGNDDEDGNVVAGGLTVHAGTAHDPVVFVEDGGGELAGFEVDLVEAIGERLDMPVTFDLADERRTAAEEAVRAGGTGAHVAVGNFADNDTEREALGVDFVNHFMDGWAVMSPDPEQSGDLDDLCGLRVTLYPGGQPEEDAVREHTADCDTPAEIVPAETKDDMVAAIRADEADVAVMSYTQAAYYAAAENPDAGLSVSFPRGNRGARGIAVPAGQVELRGAVFDAMGELMRDGTYQELLRRWHIEEAAVDAPDVNLGS